MSNKQGSSGHDNVRQIEITFPSAWQGTQIVGTLWVPTDAEPRALVQVAHGMAEHAGRYAPLAHHLAALGYAVLAHDHAGHGRSVSSPNAWGILPAHEGAGILVQDVFGARRAAGEVLAQESVDPKSLAHVLLGHSMGSFIARICAASAGADLAGLVVCGTGELPRALSLTAYLAARGVSALRGQDHKSAALDSLGAGGYSSKVKGATGPFDWLSYDRDNVQAYEEDPACGFMFSAGGYANLTQLTWRSASRACYRATPADLPILVISGSDDPVGDFGRAPKRVAQRYRQTGHAQVEIQLYEHMRHEILNEGQRARQSVWHDLISWLEGIA